MTMNNRRHLMEMLADRDPAAFEELATADDRRELRERIVATPRPEAVTHDPLGPGGFRLGWAPRAAAVVAVGVLLALVGVPRLTGGGSSSAVATPPMTVQPGVGQSADPSMLRELAEVASMATAREGHRATVGWDLSTAVSEGQGDSEILASRRHVWIQSPRVVTCDSEGLPVDVLVAPEQRAEDVPDCDRVEIHEDGTFHLPVLPEDQDPEALREALATNHQVDDVTEVVTAFLDVANVRPLTAIEASALLAFLSDAEGIIDYGRVDDRAGRQGHAFGFDIAGRGLPMQQVLIFDTRNGQLLAEETLLTRDAGSLNVDVPSTIGYSVYTVSQQAPPR